MNWRTAISWGMCLSMVVGSVPAQAEGKWEVTPESKQASDDGLAYLARTQGPAGNWNSKDLGIVGLGVLAFLSAGHTPDIGPYGEHIRRGLDYMVSNQKPSGLLNIADERRDNYNHGLAAFVLTQAYGMSKDPRIGKGLERALRLMIDVQCEDGGWDYVARKTPRGHDLSLCVMQAKALRGAMDVGMEIPPATIRRAIQRVRGYYKTVGKPDGKGPQYGTNPLAGAPGQFCYTTNPTPACGAAGAVCLQEFGQYDDFRIKRSLDQVILGAKKKQTQWKKNGQYARQKKLPMDDSYTLYYYSQALYQVGGERWRRQYPLLRDALVLSQMTNKDNRAGSWNAAGHGTAVFSTAVAVFTLNIPNRYLPILQQDQGYDRQKGEARKSKAKPTPKKSPADSNTTTAPPAPRKEDR